MNKKTRKITLSALFAALTVIALYIASIWPSGQIALVAFSSIFAAAAVVESGVANGIYVYAVSAALGFLILPNIAVPLLHTLFFGYYPVVKSLIERLRSAVLQWLLKLCVFNAALTVMWFFLREIVFDFGEYMPGAALMYLGGSVIFVLFDYGFTKGIWFYINRISNYMKKGN